MTQWHRQYGNIHRGVVAATRQLLSSIEYDTPEQAAEVFDSWAGAACQAYNISPARVELRSCREMGGNPIVGGYNDDTIQLTTPSLLILFHQFRHHMQAHGACQPRDTEMDAHAWACSLLYSAAPEKFNMLVFEGCIPGVMIDDLTPAVAPVNESTPLSEEQQRTFDEMAEALIEEMEPDSDLAKLMEEIAESDD